MRDRFSFLSDFMVCQMAQPSVNNDLAGKNVYLPFHSATIFCRSTMETLKNGVGVTRPSIKLNQHAQPQVSDSVNTCHSAAILIQLPAASSLDHQGPLNVVDLTILFKLFGNWFIIRSVDNELCCSKTLVLFFFGT